MYKVFIFLKSKVVLFSLLGILIPSAIIIPVVLAVRHPFAQLDSELYELTKYKPETNQSTYPPEAYNSIFYDDKNHLCINIVGYGSGYLKFESPNTEHKQTLLQWWNEKLENVENNKIKLNLKWNIFTSYYCYGVQSINISSFQCFFYVKK